MRQQKDRAEKAMAKKKEHRLDHLARQTFTPEEMEVIVQDPDCEIVQKAVKERPYLQ